MKHENEATPDKEAVHKYGYVEGGDGKMYRVARGGMNARGQELDDLYEEIKELATKEGGDRSKTYSTARKFFHLALNPFYSEGRIDDLLDEGVFVWRDIGDVVVVVSGDDVIEELKKKQSSDVD